MKKNVLKIAALMTMCLVLIMGCGKSYGDKLYTCSSKNMLGFEGAYLSGDTITLHFETKNDMSDEVPFLGLGHLLSAGKLGSSEIISIITVDSKIVRLDGFKVSMNSGEGTISIPLEGYTADEIRCIHFTGDGYVYDIDIVKNHIEAMVDTEDDFDWYMQDYDGKKWTEAASLSGMAN